MIETWNKRDVYDYKRFTNLTVQKINKWEHQHLQDGFGVKKKRLANIKDLPVIVRFLTDTKVRGISFSVQNIGGEREQKNDKIMWLLLSTFAFI